MRAIFPIISFIITTSLTAGFAQQSTDGKGVSKNPVELAEPEADRWRFSLSPYSWLPSIDTTVGLPSITIGPANLGGDLNIDVPWYQTIENIFDGKQFAFSAGARMEVWKGKWGFFADGYYIYSKVKSQAGASTLVFRDRINVTATASATSKVETGQVNFGPQYLIATFPLSSTPDGPSVALTVYGGGRVNFITSKVDGTVTVSAASPLFAGATSANFRSNSNSGYIEPMAGLKTNWKLGDRLTAMVRGDVGGWGLVQNDNLDCDLEAIIAWEICPNTFMDLGYRARGQWQTVGRASEVTVKGWYHGPEVGMTFKF